jgi:hypothetical protein
MGERTKSLSKILNAKTENSSSQTKKINLSKAINSPLDHILFLQRIVGNQTVQRLFKSGVIQAKLKIGEPNDMYEQEADRVAEKVMRMPEPGIQMKPTWLLAKSPSCGEEKVLQAKGIEQGTATLTSSAEESLSSLKDSGKPLSAPERDFFEQRFGTDLGGVRIHASAEAGKLSHALAAVAFTLGPNIYFASGSYNPATSGGRRLLAHELTHVVQQGELQMSRLQRQFLPGNLPKATNYRFDTFQITERDLSDPEITARFQRLSVDQLRSYLDRVTDPAVRSYILKLLSSPSRQAPKLHKCTVEDCLSDQASFERVSRIVTREAGPVFDVFECYDALAAAAAKGRPPLTPEAGCAQCIVNCDLMDLDEAFRTCRDRLLNQCIDLTDSWKRFVRRPF